MSACFPWDGSINDAGYGTVYVDGKNRKAHRVVYEQEFGPLPDDVKLDHLCHTEAEREGTCDGGPTCLHRRCVNTAHLEPVTNAENIRRGSSPGMRAKRSGFCARGHRLVEPNLVRGTGQCRACAQARAVVFYQGEGDLELIATSKYARIMAVKK